MASKKIGVITFWYTQDNYGQILQLYALQTYLKKLGHSPYIIRYDNRFEKAPIPSKKSRIISAVRNPSKIITYINKLLNKKISTINPGNRDFNKFRKEHINMSHQIYKSLEELKINPPKADIYICGSDVIWSEGVNKMAYFLDFGDENIKRIAYAPSFGSACVSDKYINKIAPLLKKFHFVGVREKSGVSICKQALYKDAHWVPDPTMLVEKDCYESLATLASYQKEYIFLYLLGSNKITQLDNIYIYAQNNQLDVKQVASQGCYNKYPKIAATIEEWLTLLKCSKYVITNSFHCCIMAIIFNKKFLYIPLKGSSKKLNERIISLLTEFSLDSRYYKKSIDEIEKDINWIKINEIIIQKKIDISKLLKKII